MISEKNLEKILRTVIKTGKFIIGAKEVSRSIKGSKIMIYSSSLPKNWISEVVNTCKSLSIPFIEFKGTSVELGRICGRPFPVSAIAIKSPGEGDISSLIGGP
ncbi:MAG: 50S ribosomal protein L30e [archaeon]|nr:50S ribosomal protein L30e [archaeon]MCP8319779.1 50S ribosomal protein L30e [archaeon]